MTRYSTDALVHYHFLSFLWQLFKTIYISIPAQIGNFLKLFQQNRWFTQNAASVVWVADVAFCIDRAKREPIIWKKSVIYYQTGFNKRARKSGTPIEGFHEAYFDTEEDTTTVLLTLVLF